jgi:hypothetical protein
MSDEQSWPQNLIDCFHRSGLQPPEDCITVDVAMHPLEVYVHAGLTSRSVRALHLELVCDALNNADVPYFVVPGLDPRSGVVGIPDEYRRAATRSLQALFGQQSGYVVQRLPPARLATAALPGHERATWQRVATASVISLRWYRRDPTGTLMLGGAHETCDIEFWTMDGNRLRAPRANRVTPLVYPDATPTYCDADDSTQLVAVRTDRGGVLRTLEDFVGVWADDITVPVDAVYTWVDGSDPAWLRKRAAEGGVEYHGEAGSVARFINRDELRYSLRSLHSNAPWIRNIWIVTDDQRPPWLQEDDRLRVVDHRDIFSDPEALPTFNSHAIESQLHHIDGLAEHFLYFNDDMFLGRPTIPQTFFGPNGIPRIYFSQTRIPGGPINADDTPVDAAAKNNRALLLEMFGKSTTQSFQHSPYVMRKSILQEIEETFRPSHTQTMRNKTRSTTDLSIPSSFHGHYALFTDRAMPGSLRYSYTQLAVPDLAERLARLLERRDSSTICLNDAYTTDSELEGQLAVLAPFLEAYFPIRSPWEVDS